MYVAPYTLSGGSSSDTGHTHNWSIIEYEALHPHKTYYKCSGCSAIGDYTGGTSYVANCALCNDTCTCSTSYAGTYKCTTTTYALTIRTGHGTSYAAIGSIPSGATVNVTKANGSWAHVEYNGISGYASMEYLVKDVPVSNAYPLPFMAYPRSSEHYAAEAFDAINGNKVGYIYGTDLCTVKEIYSNGWCLVNCDWGTSGTRDVYTLTETFLAQTVEPYPEIILTEGKTYSRVNSSDELSKVDVGDRVTIINNTSSMAQMICPNKNPEIAGEFLCVWVNYNVFFHTHTPGPVATCTMPQVCITCDATIVEALGHDPGPAATCTSAQTCTRCGVETASIKDHTRSAVATCTTPQTCIVCGTILVPATGHHYTAGNYTEPAHPHKIYNVCSCGEKQDSGRTATLQDCEICNPPVQYEVTFVTNGSQTSILPHYGEAGDVITLMSVTKDGYIFLGWDTNSSANTAVYKGGDSYTINGDVTLYAVWQKETISVDGVSLNKTSASIDIGDTLSLTATVSPTDATDKVVTWTSSNNTVAKVSNGTVTALSPGTSTITVTTADGGYEAQCIVTVNEIELPENAPVITIADVRGQIGKTVTIPILIENNPGIVSMTLEVEYDENVFTLVAVNDTELLNGAMHSDIYSSPYTLTWYNDTSHENFHVNGTVVELVFEISENAEPGDYIFSVKSPKHGIYDYDGTTIPFNMDNGTCTIKQYLIGDVNGDGDITNLDRLVLSRYLAKWSGYDDSAIIKEAADINGDGEVTNYDRLFLSRHLAKWSGYENFPNS